ncbi:flagellar basal-body rod protein FlgF [Burkholderia sp. WAC0059]|uniref:flagellar basal-body rod protein FlgF n=1 Tax=Burkholderia sp. WAC0059 TaxID=2066022 RepID=UPI000C7F5474|nr:flagellar basal-body rod protein FlgF [Burkholderia sp. WAC0059]PLZ00661.1 flagellar basal-body rod protein FlgF [Burkholderia sp. WAC0059]
MDRLIYTAMTGASQALEQQAVVANNLANASTTGFRAQLANFRDVPMSFGDGSSVNDQTTRTFVLSATPGSDMTPGEISRTGNPLDIAIQGSGWLAVQGPDGNEAYTRAGDLHVDANGQLMTGNNMPVIGQAGPIGVPPGSQVTIGSDGTISAIAPGNPPDGIAVVDQLKLVNPQVTMVRGDDGLYRTPDGNPADADPNVQVVAGALEGSNVNPVAQMVSMITNARQFEMQTKLLTTADQNDQSANNLLNFSS